MYDCACTDLGEKALHEAAVDVGGAVAATSHEVRHHPLLHPRPALSVQVLGHG